MRLFKLNPTVAAVSIATLTMAGGLTLQASDRDAKIEDSARQSYNFKTYLKDDSIKVSSTHGAVVLTGTVSHEYHKLLAQETVAGLPGVKGVDNRLAVVGDQPAERSDGWLTTKVKTVLAFHKNVSASNTQVTTANGVVTLTGKSDSDAQKQLTGEYAYDVEGVKEVRNELVVTHPGKPASRSMGTKVDDASITAQLKMNLLFRKSTHTLATKVETKNGVVTLRGEARNGAERDLVAKIAGDIDGVNRVSNHMTVKPS